MSRAVRVFPVVLLAFLLAGCTAGGAATISATRSPVEAAPAAVALAAGGFDVGNDRPHVTYDGLMVRRRVVIAIHPAPGDNLAAVRTEMDRAATRLHTSLTNISPDVLDPALMERLAPELVLTLPTGGTLDQARSLIASRSSKSVPGVAQYNAASVLVHDLRFTVASPRPGVLAQAIAREGILSDALGNYTTTIGSRELQIAYTGPLLSDALVESVRAGIARPAHAQPDAVTISPRSTIGVGVDMAKEPAPPPEVIKAPTAHQHH